MSKENCWQDTKHKLPIGTRVCGQVTKHQPFGFFVVLPDVEFEGLIQITDIKDEGHVMPSEFPEIGSTVEAVVLGFKELGRQVWLGIKPSQMRCSNLPNNR